MEIIPTTEPCHVDSEYIESCINDTIHGVRFDAISGLALDTINLGYLCDPNCDLSKKDFRNCLVGKTNPGCCPNDNDCDGFTDDCDLDDDNDGIPDTLEFQIICSGPQSQVGDNVTGTVGTIGTYNNIPGDGNINAANFNISSLPYGNTNGFVQTNGGANNPIVSVDIFSGVTDVVIGQSDIDNSNENYLWRVYDADGILIEDIQPYLSVGSNAIVTDGGVGQSLEVNAISNGVFPNNPVGSIIATFPMQISKVEIEKVHDTNSNTNIGFFHGCVTIENDGDGDGIISRLDPDDDGDGIPTYFETPGRECHECQEINVKQEVSQECVDCKEIEFCFIVIATNEKVDGARITCRDCEGNVTDRYAEDWQGNRFELADITVD